MSIYDPPPPSVNSPVAPDSRPDARLDALRPGILESHAVASALAGSLAELPAAYIPEELQALAILAERSTRASLADLDRMQSQGR